jgi:hypothetical protein
VELDIPLTTGNWNSVFSAINTAGKFVSLDLSTCTRSSTSGGNGLRPDGVFEPYYPTATGKGKIVNLTLPDLATDIVAGTSSDPAFKHFTALKTVSGAGVTGIGNYAFYTSGSNNGPAALTSVSFPAAESIGNYAFSGCAALTSVSIPLAESIGQSAFQSCAALTSVSIPLAASIGQGAFSGCAALTSVSIPLAESIGQSAFSGCAALTSVSFPLAESIGQKAFYGCAALSSVSFPLAESIGQGAFTNCAALTSVSFPLAASIGYGAFSDCAALTSVSFPLAESIGQGAFYGCAALTSVTLGATPPSVGTYLFNGVNSARTVTVRIPTGSQTDYGVPGLPDTNFNNASTDNSWGYAFRGKGWNGASYQSGTVNTNITLRFETYTP